MSAFCHGAVESKSVSASPLWHSHKSYALDATRQISVIPEIETHDMRPAGFRAGLFVAPAASSPLAAPEISHDGSYPRSGQQAGDASARCRLAGIRARTQRAEP